MKICVMCPGSFTYQRVDGKLKFDGLDSPGRGETRWSSQYVKMLAKAGHQVIAASGGLGENKREQFGALLVDQSKAQEYGPFDLYIDSSWWDGKVTPVVAKKYVALKWSPENYLYNDIEDNFYIAYPYVSHHFNFNKDNFPHKDRTFALPTMFEEPIVYPPNWEAKSIFLPGKMDTTRNYQKYLDVILSVLSKYSIEGTSKKLFQEAVGDRLNFDDPNSTWVDVKSYDQVLESFRKSKLNLPILNPGCVIEAAFMGVPSIFWEHGGFYNPLASSLSVLVEHEAPPERFTYITEMLLNNKKKYFEVVYATQEYFSAHTYFGAKKYFDLMTDTIGLT